MKIIALEAENIKRLVAVSIKPDADLVEITGRNGAGKSSVLDAIWWALAGADHIQAEPIRRGANEARIVLDLGEMIVTRTFKKKGDSEVTTAITVKNADGWVMTSPQKMLDSLVATLSFDPLQFLRMKPKEQIDVLKGFVPDVDFAAMDKRRLECFEMRRDLNRKHADIKAVADRTYVPLDAPTAPVDIDAIISEIEKATEANAAHERAISRLDTAERAAEGSDELAARDRKRAAELRAEAAELEASADAHAAEAKHIRTVDIPAIAVPARIDIGPLRINLARAQKDNAAFEAARERNRLVKKADETYIEANDLTRQIAELDKAKLDAIAAANLPIEGLSFSESAVTLNGIPFEQASDAEQLRTSIALAMAANPKLRVVRVRDGSLLDDQAMKMLAEMAGEKDFQVWIERVDSSGSVGFVIEDGMVKGSIA